MRGKERKGKGEIERKGKGKIERKGKGETERKGEREYIPHCVLYIFCVYLCAGIFFYLPIYSCMLVYLCVSHTIL
jgi:hypothetical protein